MDILQEAEQIKNGESNSPTKTIREGMSSDCKLDPALVLAILLGGREHPCDRCNMDRSKCRGYERLDADRKQGK